jgi:hypothetical protein
MINRTILLDLLQALLQLPRPRLHSTNMPSIKHLHRRLVLLRLRPSLPLTPLQRLPHIPRQPLSQFIRRSNPIHHIRWRVGDNDSVQAGRTCTSVLGGQHAAPAVAEEAVRRDAERGNEICKFRKEEGDSPELGVVAFFGEMCGVAAAELVVE